MAPPIVSAEAARRPHGSAPEWVRNEVLRWLERGDYQPGDALPSERELQALFGVSRVVVREAIVRLQAVGLVTVEHGRGCRVSDAVPDLLHGPFRVWLEWHRGEVIDLLKLRRALDGLAAEEAASRADPDAIRRITDAEQAFADAVGRDQDPVRLVGLDKEFHVAIATASGVTIVAQLLGELDQHAANIHRTSMAMSGRPKVSVREHRQIVSAIAAHKPGPARRAAERHVGTTIDQVRSISLGSPTPSESR